MKYLITTLLLIFIVACEDSTTDPIVTDPPEYGILVLNEGGFGQNNSGFSIYNLTTEEVTQHPYLNNNGFDLGDTGNDMVVSGDKIYAAVSNSNKVEVISLTNFQSLGFIDFGENGQPREIAVLNDSIIYVTSLYRNMVMKCNTAQMEVVAEIAVGEIPEGIELAENRLFVANSNFGSGNTVSVIDIASDTVIDQITVGYNPRIMFGDGNNVYTVCSGQYDGTGKGGVYKINPSTLVVTDSLIIIGNPGEAAFDGNSSVFVANNSGVLKIALSNLPNNSTDTPLIAASEVNSNYGVVYSLFYDDTENLLYAGNPNDFVQNGSIVVFDAAGTKVKEFETGINPGTILKFELSN